MTRARDYIVWAGRLLAAYGTVAYGGTVYRLLTLSCRDPRIPEACQKAVTRGEHMAIGMVAVLIVLTFVLAQIAARTSAADTG